MSENNTTNHYDNIIDFSHHNVNNLDEYAKNICTNCKNCKFLIFRKKLIFHLFLTFSKSVSDFLQIIVIDIFESDIYIFRFQYDILPSERQLKRIFYTFKLTFELINNIFRCNNTHLSAKSKHPRIELLARHNINRNRKG